MMNGELVKDAVSVKSGSHLGDILTGKGDDLKKIQRLYLMSLGLRSSSLMSQLY